MMRHVWITALFLSTTACFCGTRGCGSCGPDDDDGCDSSSDDTGCGGSGDVGAPCSGANQGAANAVCSQSISLNSSALSIGRGRRDIENLTLGVGDRQLDVNILAPGRDHPRLRYHLCNVVGEHFE